MIHLKFPKHLKIPISLTFNPSSRRFYLCLVVILAILLRSCLITKSPPSPYLDETVIGYTAYSLAETGRDEYGQPWPILLRSYGAFSSTLYTFVTAPIVKTFGLNIISVRLLSILSGVGLVMLVGWHWGLTAAWLTAIAPVFVFFARGAYEANFALLLLTAGLFAGIRYIRNPGKIWSLLICSLLMALSTYSYLGERLISPVLLLAICFFAGKKLIKEKRSIFPVILSIILFITISVPLLRVSFTSGANQRLQTLLPDNNPKNYLISFASRYYAYFSPQNLFSRPDPDIQRSYPEVSVFYWWWLFPFFAGLLVWFKKLKHWKDEDWLLILLILVSPLAGAVTRDYFSTLRALPMFLPIIWVTARGINQLNRYRYPVIILFTVIGIISLYYNAVLLRYERNKEWLYPYPNLAVEIAKLKDRPVIVDNSRLKPFYIYYAFVNKLDPKIMQGWHDFDLDNYYSYYQFPGNMSFLNLKIRPIDFRDVYDDYYLIVDEISVSPDQAAEHLLTKTATVKNLDGSIAFNIYQTNPLEKCRLDLTQTKTSINPFCAKYLK